MMTTAIVKQNLIKASPWILMGFGAAGEIASVIFAVKATPKAMLLLEEAEDKKGEELTTPEKVKAVWKVYIPPVLMGAASIGCFFGAQGINMRRNAALMSLYTITEHTLRQYQEKVVETIGEKKAGEVLAKVDRQKLADHPASTSQVIITGDGDYLCYDSLSGRYFMSDVEKLRRIQNDVNQLLIQQMYISLNEFYERIGLKPIAMGYDTGWTVDDMIDLRFGTQLSDEGKPCLVLDYNVYPRTGYNKLY